MAKARTFKFKPAKVTLAAIDAELAAMGMDVADILELRATAEEDGEFSAADVADARATLADARKRVLSAQEDAQFDAWAAAQ